MLFCLHPMCLLSTSFLATYSRSFQPSFCDIFYPHYRLLYYPSTIELSMCYYFVPVSYVPSLFVLGMAQKRPHPAAIGLHVPAYTLTCVACNYAAQSYSAYVGHLVSCPDPSQVRCSHCSTTFTDT